MAHQDYLIGVLKKDGYISTPAGDILLTGAARQAGRSTQPVPLAVDQTVTGEIVVVQGELSGEVMYLGKL